MSANFAPVALIVAPALLLAGGTYGAVQAADYERHGTLLATAYCLAGGQAVVESDVPANPLSMTAQGGYVIRLACHYNDAATGPVVELRDNQSAAEPARTLPPAAARTIIKVSYVQTAGWLHPAVTRPAIEVVQPDTTDGAPWLGLTADLPDTTVAIATEPLPA